MPKDTSQTEAMSNNKRIRPIALATIQLCLSEGISQLLSQSVSRKFCLIILFNNLKEICSNLLRAFWVDVKACLSLVLHQYFFWGKRGWFLSDVFSWDKSIPFGLYCMIEKINIDNPGEFSAKY